MKKKLKLNTLIKYSWVLIACGVIFAFISMLLPFIGNIDANKISAAGQISASIASIFGISIAALAIWVYLEKEDVITVQSEKTLYYKHKLQVALDDLSQQILQSHSYYARNPSKEILENFSFMLTDTILFVNETIKECRESELGVVLNNVKIGERQSAYFIMTILSNKLSIYNERTHDRPELHNTHIIDLTCLLAKALATINEVNIPELLQKQINTLYIDELIEFNSEEQNIQ